MKYQRILLKLSGEALMGDLQYGIDPTRISQYAEAIKAWETVLLLNPEHEKSIQNIDKTRRKMRQI